MVAFRRWLQEKAGGDVGWAGGATSQDLPPKLSRKVVLNRWDRHGKDCASCKEVHTGLTKTRLIGWPPFVLAGVQVFGLVHAILPLVMAAAIKYLYV